jgi:hypothetical protein
MNVIGFYNKGVRVVIPGAAGGIDRHRSFGGGGASADVELGIVPAKNAKLVTDAAHGVIKHDGVEHLVLNAGHVYEVAMLVGGIEKNDVVSAEHGHVILPLPKGAEIVSVEAVVEQLVGGE